MAAESKTSVAAHFVAYNFPSAADFGNLIDSYTDASDALEALATAAKTGSVGLVYVSGASALTMYSATPTGLRIANAATTAAAVGLLGAGAVGSAIFFASATAAGQQQLGGGTVGRQVYSAISTADIQSLLTLTSAATQTAMEGASAADVYVTPERFRSHPASPKAWALISGGTGPELKASFNIGALSRTAAGHYRLTFSLAMTDTNYATLVTMRTEGGAFYTGMQNSAATISAGGTGIRLTNLGGTDADPAGAANVVIFGDHP